MKEKTLKDLIDELSQMASRMKAEDEKHDAMTIKCIKQMSDPGKMIEAAEKLTELNEEMLKRNKANQKEQDELVKAILKKKKNEL